MKKALVVSPYLDHLGGGERYMLSVAQVLEQLGYSIYFAWDNLAEINNLATMLGISLNSPKLDPSVKNLYFSSNPLSMYMATKPYDLVVYLSDGSLPLLGSRRNIIHMQVPFHDVGGRNWKNNIKKNFINAVIVNSHFTKNIVDHEYAIHSHVVYPPVSVSPKKAKKAKTILSVGRFEPSLNAKKQDVMIEAFKKLSPTLSGWKLVLAGASASEEWVNTLKKKAGKLPIVFQVNASYELLRDLYAEASIYWHAAGYGIDETKNPELVEHFGITTVEAIANNCIPLVVPYGGQREIVTDPLYHWEDIETLINQTIEAIKGNLPKISISDDYSPESFQKNLMSLL